MRVDLKAIATSLEASGYGCGSLSSGSLLGRSLALEGQESAPHSLES